MSKNKVLIICYYWPPAGGPGVQRWLKFVKYLPEYGIEPIVYCPKNPNYPIIDDSLINEIHSKTTVIKHPINEPYKLAALFSKKSKSISKGIIPEKEKQHFIEKLMLFIRGNFFIPDARVGWVKPSVSFLEAYILKHQINTIITTGPPHSLHLIGAALKQKIQVQWITDFRDPWTSIGYHKALKLTKQSQKKHKQLEKKVLQEADKIIVTSHATKKEFLTLTNSPITVITNGYDKTLIHDKSILLDSKFTISHIGSLLSKRNPELLWQVLQDIIDEVEGFKADFKLQLIGSVSESVLKSIKRFELFDNTINYGYVSHNEALRYQLQSQVLLLIEINSEDTKAIIPGKLFEYLLAKRPILALGPKQSDVEQIIKRTQSGAYFNYNAYQELKATIIKYYKDYKTKALSTKTTGIKKYSRKALTQRLASVILQ